MNDEAINQELLNALAEGKFSFLDLGCGAGRSIATLEKKFNLQRGSGCGADISPRKVAEARAAQTQVVLADVTRTPFPPGCVSFISMCDFLEHLHSKESAIDILERAGSIAKDFLFIRHPSFQDIDYLKTLGLKLDWTHWSGHTNMLLIEDFEQIFRALGWNTFVVLPQKQILDSSHPAVVPFSAPIDTVRYDQTLHGPKDLVYFNKPVWTQFDIFVRLNDLMNDDHWRNVVHTFHAPTALEDAGRGLAKARTRLAATEAALSELRKA